MEEQKNSPGNAANTQMHYLPGKTQIKTYDFKRPDKFSRDQLRTLAIMHETFARLATNVLSSYLHCQAHVRLTGVDQFNYEEFIRSLPNPALLGIIDMDPLKGSTVLEIDPAITFGAIDRLFGGQGKAAGTNRDITDIEAGVLEGLYVRLLGSIREAWGTIIDLRPRLAALETNPQFALVVPPVEMVVLITLEAEIGESRGMMNFCIPFLTIEPLIEKLTAKYWFSSVRKGKTGENYRFLKPKIDNLKIDCLLYYQAERIGLDALHKLQKGDCIRLPGYAAQELFLESGGKTVLKLHRENVRGSKQPVFTVKSTSRSAADRQAGKQDANGSTNGAGLDLKALLPGITKELGALFQEGITGLHTKMQEIRKKQDELSDQLFFEAKDMDPLAQNGAGRQKPFGFVTLAGLDGFFNLICREHPQAIALILAYLPADLAGIILARLEPELQAGIAERIACLGKVSMEVLEATERVLKKKMESLYLTADWQVGGVVGMVNILNLAQRSLERNVIDTLDRCNAELSEAIKKRLFVFEDVVLLDKKTLQKVLSRVKKEDLAMALKKTDPQVLAVMNDLLTREEQEVIRQKQEVTAPSRLTDIEDAQQRIVAVIKELEEKGEIVVARPGETV